MRHHLAPTPVRRGVAAATAPEFIDLRRIADPSGPTARGDLTALRAPADRAGARPSPVAPRPPRTKAHRSGRIAAAASASPSAPRLGLHHRPRWSRGRSAVRRHRGARRSSPPPVLAPSCLAARGRTVGDGGGPRARTPRRACRRRPGRSACRRSPAAVGERAAPQSASEVRAPAEKSRPTLGEIRDNPLVENDFPRFWLRFVTGGPAPVGTRRGTPAGPLR